MLGILEVEVLCGGWWSRSASEARGRARACKLPPYETYISFEDKG